MSELNSGAITLVLYYFLQNTHFGYYHTISITHDNGVFMGSVVFTATTCPDPGTPLHGTRMCTTATHAYGSICSFHCDHGFQLVGNDRIICRADSGATSWSGITPICKGTFYASIHNTAVESFRMIIVSYVSIPSFHKK